MKLLSLILLSIASNAFSQSLNPNEVILKLSPSAPLLKRGENPEHVLNERIHVALRQAGSYQIARALPEQFPSEAGQFLLLRYAQTSTPLSDLITQLAQFSEIEYAQFNHVLRCENASTSSIPPLRGGRGVLGLSDASQFQSYTPPAPIKRGIKEMRAIQEFPNDAPNDSLFARQWALETLRATAAWKITRGARDVLVAVIDTGVELDHPDLQANLWINTEEDLNQNGRADSADYNHVDDDDNGFVDDVIGWDFTDAPSFSDGGDHVERDNDPSDENGHGTSASGIIAAVANNRIGIAGLAPDCRIMVLRAGNSQGLLEEDDVASAIVYAVANGARVINMSFGDNVTSPMLRDIIRFAHGRGVVPVASAGNSASEELFYPAGFAETISVGASTTSDQLASFSSYGERIDVVAPGEDIWTTNAGGGYGPFTGTSAAAPLVSAVAALLLARSPDMNNEMARAALQNNARDLGQPGWDRFFGAGRIDALAALQLERVARAEILSPRMDMGLPNQAANFVVRGTALGAFVSAYELAYGEGDAPLQWRLINSTSGRQVLEDSLGVLSLQNLRDGVYTLRLQVQQQSGPTIEDKVRMFLDRTPPQISALRLQDMIERAHSSMLIEFKTDDLCRATLWWRASGSNTSFTPQAFNYLTTKHRLHLSLARTNGTIEFYLTAVNQSGLETRDDNNGRYYQFQTAQPEITARPFVELPFATSAALPAGYLWHGAADFDGNGNGELLLSRYGKNNALGALTIFERNESGFAARYSSSQPLIPRDVGDSDHDGRLEILAGFGARSFIYEAPLAGEFPARLMWADTNNFWAARFADLDADGRIEIIGRNADTFSVLENEDGEFFRKIAALRNFSLGANLTGVPHAEIADFDGDGRREILLGDFDGDLYIHEAVGDNQFAPVWSDSLPLIDSIAFIRAGDFDGDGRQDFAAGCHSSLSLNAEHEFDARHWLFRIYCVKGDNQFEVLWEQRFFGLQSPKDFDAGLGAGDIDGDGRDELFLNLFPESYVAEYENGRVQVAWYYQPGRSNTTVVAALEPGRPPAFYFSDGERVRAFSLSNNNTGAPAPQNFEARALDEQSVRLHWRAVTGAEGYAIYRAASDSATSLLTAVTGEDYLDQGLESERIYRYAIATIDSQNAVRLGPATREVAARPSAPPRVLAAHFFAPYHVAVTFSEPMQATLRDQQHFELLVDDVEIAEQQPESVVLSRSASEVILAFPQQDFSPGRYEIKVRNAFDANGVALDTSTASAEFEVQALPSRFYLASAKLESPQTVLVQFNLTVDQTTASEPRNYALTVTPNFAEPLTFASAEMRADDPASVRLRLRNGHIAPLGRSFVITARDIKSSNGLALTRGEGDAIGFAPVSSNLAHVRVYPNPYIAARHAQLTIAGLTENATITILDEQGRALITLREQGGDGGYHWDARDESGKLLASGVYVCYVTSGEEKAWTKFVIVR